MAPWLTRSPRRGFHTGARRVSRRRYAGDGASNMAARATPCRAGPSAADRRRLRGRPRRARRARPCRPVTSSSSTTGLSSPSSSAPRLRRRHRVSPQRATGTTGRAGPPSAVVPAGCPDTSRGSRPTTSGRPSKRGWRCRRGYRATGTPLARPGDGQAPRPSPSPQPRERRGGGHRPPGAVARRPPAGYCPRCSRLNASSGEQSSRRKPRRTSHDSAAGLRPGRRS